MTKARDLADLGNKTSLDEINDAYDAGALSNRNLIINGAMQVAQRRTSLTGIGNNAGGPFVCDRFQHVQGSTGGSGVMTMEQSTDAADGFGSSLKLTVTTADTLSVGENVGIRYRSEGRDGQSLKFGTSSAEKFTVSFWTKASVAGTYSLQIFGPARSALSSYTINSANTWEYKTITFNGDTSVALPNTSVAGFEVTWHLDAGPDDITSAYDWGNTAAFRAVTGQVNLMANTGNTWQVTGVQLEVGDTATPFEHRSYSDQLQSCKRFFELTTLNDHIFSKYNSAYAYGNISWEVEKRAVPTTTFTGDWKAYGSGQGASSVVNLHGQSASKRSTQLYIDNGSYSSYFVRQSGSNPGLIFVDAEL
jgi:hypothetical protein